MRLRPFFRSRLLPALLAGRGGATSPRLLCASVPVYLAPQPAGAVDPRARTVDPEPRPGPWTRRNTSMS